jgi:hypothetical protein
MKSAGGTGEKRSSGENILGIIGKGFSPFASDMGAEQIRPMTVLHDEDDAWDPMSDN